MASKQIEQKEHECFVCKKLTTKFCQKCKTIYYCSRECQLYNWSVVHKHFCASLPFPQPSPNTVIGVYLPENSPQPVLVKLPTKLMHDHEEGSSFTTVDLDEYIGDVYKGFNYMPSNPLKGIEGELKDTLLFHYRDSFNLDGSKDNVCIQKITENKCPFPWRGPMVVIKQSGNYFRLPDGDPKDITVEDFSNIIDYLLWYGSKLPGSVENPF